MWRPMRRIILLVCGLVACGGDSDRVGHLADAPAARIIVEPADGMVTVINDAVGTQAYTAHTVDDHGENIDVTGETTFALHDASYGTFSGATVSVTGQGA